MKRLLSLVLLLVCILAMTTPAMAASPASNNNKINFKESLAPGENAIYFNTDPEMSMTSSSITYEVFPQDDGGGTWGDSGVMQAMGILLTTTTEVATIGVKYLVYNN